VKLRRYSCRHLKNLLPLHVGGDLPRRQAEAVDEHLHACLSCFREYRELTTMRERLGVLTEQPLPAGALDGFADEVMARIALAEPGPRAPLPAAMERARLWPRYAAAAALLLGVGLGAHSLDLLPGTAAAPAAHHATTAQSASDASGTQGLSAPGALADGSDFFEVFPPMPAEQGPRSIAPAPVFHLTPVSGFEGRPAPRRHRGLSPSMPESMRSMIDTVGTQALPAIRQDGGLVPEPERVLRLRDPR